MFVDCPVRIRYLYFTKVSFMHLIPILRPSTGHSTLSFRYLFPMCGQIKLDVLVVLIVQDMLPERSCVFLKHTNEKMFS